MANLLILGSTKNFVILCLINLKYNVFIEIIIDLQEIYC